MKKYIGTKIIEARPGTMAEAQAIKSNLPESMMKEIRETTEPDGYIVKSLKQSLHLA